MSPESIKEQIQQLQYTWHKEIPVSKFMQLEVLNSDENVLILSAPIAPNINVHKTMFAGSIYTLATLCGWGAIHLFMQMHSKSGSIVLSEGSINYQRPIKETPTAQVNWSLLTCNWQSLNNRENQPIDVVVKVQSETKDCALFKGRYIVLPAE